MRSRPLALSLPWAGYKAGSKHRPVGGPYRASASEPQSNVQRDHRRGEGVGGPYVSRLVTLAFLVPDIVTAISIVAEREEFGPSDRLRTQRFSRSPKQWKSLENSMGQGASHAVAGPGVRPIFGQIARNGVAFGIGGFGPPQPMSEAQSMLLLNAPARVRDVRLLTPHYLRKFIQPPRPLLARHRGRSP